MTRFTWRIALLALCLTALLTSPAAAGKPDRPLGTNGAAVPKVEWSACPAGVEPEFSCSVVDVPLSYRKPGGRQIELALGLLPATDQEHKLGSVFWNPGGPGGSGRIPFELSPAIHERFDVVGFDPRGIAASTPLKCFESNEQAVSVFGSDFPLTLAEQQRFIAENIEGTDLCARNGGPIIRHMSTANVARDLDLLRRAVGDRKLNFLGYSYGTAIGAYYANLFPNKVRALTLDGVIDPVEWTSSSRSAPIEYRLGSFYGADQALDTFLAACAADERCAFREPGVGLRRKYDRLLARVLKAPVALGEGDEAVVVTYQFVVYSTLGLLYEPALSSALAELLQQVWAATEQPAARVGAKQGKRNTSFLPARAAGREEVPYDGWEWYSAVECTDSVGPANPWQWPRYARLADQEAGPFGAPWVYFSQPCATWPAKDSDRYAGPWDRRTSNPILLIGNSVGDPATPYEDAQSTERLLHDARLLTLRDFGHTGQGGKSRCIDDAVDRYFIQGKLPRRGLVCRPDRGPFDPEPLAAARKREQRAELFPDPPVPVELKR